MIRSTIYFTWPHDPVTAWTPLARMTKRFAGIETGTTIPQQGDKGYHDFHVAMIAEAGFNSVGVQCAGGSEVEVNRFLRAVRRHNALGPKEPISAYPFLAMESYRDVVDGRIVDKTFEFEDPDDRREFLDLTLAWLNRFDRRADLWATDPWTGAPIVGLWYVFGLKPEEVPVGFLNDLRGEADGELFIRTHNDWGGARSGSSATGWLFNGMGRYQPWTIHEPGYEDRRAGDLLTAFVNRRHDPEYWLARRHGEGLRSAYAEASLDRPDWIEVESYNERGEGSGIEPCEAGTIEHHGTIDHWGRDPYVYLRIARRGNAALQEVCR